MRPLLISPHILPFAFGTDSAIILRAYGNMSRIGGKDTGPEILVGEFLFGF